MSNADRRFPDSTDQQKEEDPRREVDVAANNDPNDKQSDLDVPGGKGLIKEKLHNPEIEPQK